MAKIITYDANPDMKWDVAETLGHEVTSFHDSGEAIDFARGNKVDIALLSGPEGIDMIRHLREISPSFKVVLFCDAPDIMEVRRALRWAPCSFLFKPVVKEELDACLKRALLKGKSTIKGSLNI
ncbi:MAG: response regulator [Deltaproteobacteria bacterium]|nr:response regulator [Deltaproteobacteria bacterium]